MKYLTIVVGILVLTFSFLAWTSEEDYMKFGTIGSVIVIIFSILKLQYLRKHPEDKPE